MLEWFNAFVWTCAIELPIYMLTLRRTVTRTNVADGSAWRYARLALGVQCATHPPFWLFAAWAGPLSTAGIALAELVITAIEAVLVWRAVGDGRRALVAAIAANSGSFGLGLALNAWLYGQAL